MDLQSTDSNESTVLTYSKLIEDLSSIPINEQDVLFEKFEDSDSEADETSISDDQLYERLKNYILFKSNLKLETSDLKSDFSLNKLNEDFQSLDTRLVSLQHFIDISKKFYSIDKN